MGKQKKDTLIENLVKDIIDSDVQEKHQTDLHTEPVTGSIVDFSKIRKQQNEDVLELDIDLPPIEDINPTRLTHANEDLVEGDKTDLKEQELDDDDSEQERQVVEADESTFATEMMQNSTLLSESTLEDQSEEEENQSEDEEDFSSAEPVDEILDHTEKVDINIYNMNSEYQNPLVAVSPTESKLALSENFKIAQSKIAELEKDNEKLSVENEDLALAAETFRNKVDQLILQLENLERKHKDLNENVDVEKELLLASIAEKDKEMDRVKQKASQLESRLQTGVRKIKVRERELENRLELVKLEGKALLKSKDDMILSLKRQLDKLNGEIEMLRQKLLEGNKSVNQKQEVIRKTVKTLRLALSLLEVEELQGQERSLKKVD